MTRIRLRLRALRAISQSGCLSTHWGAKASPTQAAMTMITNGTTISVSRLRGSGGGAGGGATSAKSLSLAPSRPPATPFGAVAGLADRGSAPDASSIGAVYRFALRPRWVLSHVLVALLVVLMVFLGLWQLRRLDQRQERNALITDRSEEPTAPLAEVVDVGGSTADADAARFRRVEASGEFEPDSDIVVRNRTFGGQPGSWLLAVLRLDDGDAVLVNRGWVPVAGEQEPSAYALAPEGPVTVEGLVETTQERGRFGSTDPAAGALRRVARVDVERLAGQVDGAVYPVWIQTEAELPDPGDLPIPAEPPELGEGSHFSYAMQWFTFSAIALIGYPIVLRRVARHTDDPPDDGPPEWDSGVRADGDTGARAVGRV